MIHESQPNESYSVIRQSLPSASESSLSEILKKSNNHMYLSTREAIAHNTWMVPLLLMKNVETVCRANCEKLRKRHGGKVRSNLLTAKGLFLPATIPRVTRGLHTHTNDWAAEQEPSKS